MRMRQVKGHIIHLILVIVFVSSCGSSSFKTSSSSSSSSTTEGTTTQAIGGSVSAITITDSVVSVPLSNLSDEDSVVLMLFAYRESGSSFSYQVGSLNENFADSSLMVKSLTADDEDLDEDLTDSFHAFLRGQEATLDPDAELVDGDGSGKYLTKNLTIGYQKTFKVLNSFSGGGSYDTVTATLRFQTEALQLYVDNRNASALDDEDLETLAIEYEAVLPLEHELFGEVSDVNNDGKVAVLFTQTVNQIGASLGGMVTGFFYAVDLFDEDQYEISNAMEIIYSFVPDTLGEIGASVSKGFAMTNIYPGVLSHEMQHVINFNMHYNLNSSSAEEGWLNEGLSHLAEDIYSANEQGYMTATGMENPARVDSYLDNINSSCFICGTSLTQRGGSYLFMRYLYEQAEKGNLTGSYSGKNLLEQLLDTNIRGIDNVVNAAMGSGGDETDFKSLLGLFGLAVYMSNTGNSNDDRLGFDGINLRSSQDDNRGTVLNGPAVQGISTFPYSDTVTGSGLNYIQLNGSTINDDDGVLSIQVGETGVFGGYLIQ